MSNRALRRRAAAHQRKGTASADELEQTIAELLSDTPMAARMRLHVEENRLEAGRVADALARGVKPW